METAASAIAVIQISTAIIGACNKYVRNVRHAAEDIQLLKDGIEAYIQIVQKLRELAETTKDDNLEALRASRRLVENSEVALRELETRLKGKGSNPMRKIGLRALKWPFTKEEVSETLQRVTDWKSTLSMALLMDNFSQSLTTAQTVNRAERNRHLEKLPRAVDAAFDSRSQEHEALCLPGTRTEALQKLVAWSENPGSETICWLKGMAGTGKSTIARTVAGRFHEQGCLAGSFFFSRGAGDRGHAGKLIATLAAQLARKDTELKQHICEAVMEDEDIAQRSLAEQCRRLIVEPVRKLAGDDASPLVFVIDALDECDREEDIEIIPQLLTMLASVKSKFRLRVLITGRPERAVRRGFLQSRSHFHREFDLFDMDDAVVKQDISLLIEDELEKVRSRHGLPDSWPASSDRVVETLSTNAGSLFIYAKTVCRFIYESPIPQRALKMLLEESSSENGHSPTAALDEMYLTILKHSYIGDEFLFKRVIGSIVLLRTQFSTAALSGLLAVDESVIASVLHNLHSALHVPGDNTEPIYLLHPSFRDFLLNPNRCTDMRFRLQADDLHRFLAHNFSGLLHRWQGRCEAREVRPTRDFLCLPQLGLPSLPVWRDQSERGAKLFPIAISPLTIDSSLGEGLYDMYRYLMRHRSLLEIAPLQMYHSTPWFGPGESFVSQAIPCLLRGAVVQSGPLPSTWSPCEQTWACARGLVVSPSADVVAFETTQSGTIEIREITTGRCISIFDGDEEPGCMSFSKDGSLLLVTAFKTVRIWDNRLAVCMHTLEKLDSPDIRYAAFDEDGKAVLIIYRSGSLTIWDTQNGIRRHTLEGHNDAVWHAEFSSDAKHIVSSSLDATVRTWDTTNGNLTRTFHGHAGPVRQSSFLQGNRMIVSQSDDQTIRVWDSVLGTCLHILGSSTGYMKLSPEKDILAYAEDNLIKLWDTVAADPVKTLEGHRGKVVSIQFSGSGRKLISNSYDFTARIWEVDTGDCLSVMNDIADRSGVGFLTPNGDRIYHTTGRGTSIYEPRNVNNNEGEFSHNDSICIVKYARDSNLMASVDQRGNLAIWDTVSASCLQELASNFGETTNLAISGDGRNIACFTTHSELRILDTEAGRWVRTIQCTKGGMSGLSFSPDGSLLAYMLSGSVYALALSTAQYALKAAVIDKACALVFSPGNDMLGVLGPHDLAQVFSICTGERDEATSSIRRISWLQAARNSKLTISMLDDVDHVRDIHTDKHRISLQGTVSPTGQIQQTSDGSAVVCFNPNEPSQLRIWDTVAGKCNPISDIPENLSSLMGSPSIHSAVLFGEESKITVWKPNARESLKIPMNKLQLACWAFDACVTRMAAGCADLTLRVFELKSQNWQTLGDLATKAKEVYVSSNGERVLSSMEGTWLQTWHASQRCSLVRKKGYLPLGLENPFSPDGTLVASIHPERGDIVEIWSSDDGSVLHTLDANSNVVHSVVWSPHGTTLACSTYDSKARLWDAVTGTCFRTIAEIDLLPGLRFSADDALFACRLRTGMFKIFDSTTGEDLLPEPFAKTASLLDMQLSEHNELLAVVTVGTDDKLEVWNISTGQRLSSCQIADTPGLVDDQPFHARISPQNSKVITSTCHLWDYQNSKISRGPRPSSDMGVSLKGHGENLAAIAHHETPELVILGFVEGASRVLHRHEMWDPIVACSRSGLVAYTERQAFGTCVYIDDIQHSRYFSLSYREISLMRFAPNDTTLVIFKSAGRLNSFDIESGVECGQADDPRNAFEEPIELYPSHTAKTVAIIYESHHVRIWDMNEGKCISTLTGHDDWVRQPSFLEDHNLVAAISADNTVRVWRTDSSDLIACFPFETTLYGVSIAHDGLSILVNDGWSDITLLIADGVPSSSAFYWISVDEGWIMWKQHKIVYIPPEYRSAKGKRSGIIYKKRSGIIYKNTVTLTSDTGHVLFLQLDPDLDPLEWTFEDPLLRNPELWIREDCLADALDY
ncbi:uncharacterized protein DSM5745_01307 [Aspergillus mulundensis]|uniref:Nephrocystin 3-like N-terminal domain-containing protein n=1 Tax=Aspergillus mulundensis TaxID=1810919 RepID=A0A3D8T604_9EURO|nr:hypothetical protein DSM5745_01307 [Aspergillus mulundensis]RDW93985.1 hypothetical protein DSM5745_01307 [Aspergillus mulundensis]